MSTLDSHVMLAEAEVRLDGARVDLDKIQEVRVQDSLVLPSAFSITFEPPPLGEAASDPLAVRGLDIKLGAQVEIAFVAPHARQPTNVFKGEITALEPSFAADGTRLVASGYDKSHRLHRERKTQTFQDMSVSAIINKVAQAVGVQVQVSAGANPSLRFLQQNNETAWELIQRLASLYGYEVAVDLGTLKVRPAGTAVGSPMEVEFGPTNPTQFAPLRLISFSPRVTAAQQVQDVHVRGWDPKQKAEITAKETVKQQGSSIGIQRSPGSWGFPAGSVTVANAPVASTPEANALAQSVASYLGHAFVGAYGVVDGHPGIRAGTTLKIRGLGPKFSGEYRCSSTTHVFGGGTGYQTRFEILGRTPRDLVDLAGAAQRNSWGDTLVIGIVTNNKDPDKLGRVRVKFPTLHATTEGWWARVVGIGAGNERGQMMLPLVNDEVLVGFEGGDPNKPYVVGALWNGKDKPGALPHEDGSYHLRTDKQIVMNAKDNVTITTDKDMTVEVKGEAKENVSKNLTIEVAQSEKVNVKQSFTLEAGSELKLKCGKAEITLNQAGQVQIKGAMIQVQGDGPVTIKGATVAIN
jgi:phage protein D